MKLPSILLVLLTVLALSASAAPTHRWSDLYGRTMRAVFIDLTDGVVVLRINGREISVPLGRLSRESRKLARRLESQQASATGREVLRFCEAHVGKKVGDGQCTALVVEAMAAAEARGMGRDFPHPGDYVWGDEVAWVKAGRNGVSGVDALPRLRAGDIIQFRDARFKGRTADGGTYGTSADHHTAVLVRATMSDLTLVIYHQNWGGGPVCQGTLDLGDLKSGWLRIYRPVPAH